MKMLLMMLTRTYDDSNEDAHDDSNEHTNDDINKDDSNMNY